MDRKIIAIVLIAAVLAVLLLSQSGQKAVTNGKNKQNATKNATNGAQSQPVANGACAYDSDCDDGKDSTRDTCDPAGKTCLHIIIEVEPSGLEPSIMPPSAPPDITPPEPPAERPPI